MRTLDEKALADAAKAVVRPEEVVWVIVADLAKVEAGIRLLNPRESLASTPRHASGRPSAPRRQP